MKSKIQIKQHDITDCGAACLASVAAYYGLQLSVSRIRQYAFTLLRPHKSVMTQALFGAAIYSVLGLSTSIYIGKITDYVLVDRNINLLNLMGVVMIVILIVRTFIGSMKSILALKTGQRIDASLILGYYKHLLTLPQHFFDTMRVGEIISRVNDAVKIRAFINNVSLDLVVNILILLFTLCLMFVYSWKLAMITLISAPLFVLIYVLFNRLNKKFQRKIMESAADLESQLVESLNSVSTIKRFGIELFANLKTEIRFVGLLRNTYKSAYGSILAGGGVEFVSTANQSIQDALIAADRLFQIMDLEREQDESQKIKLEPNMIGDITFKDVFFRYGTRKQVFSSLNLSIQKGRTTAIVGESGSGKTTLASLIQQLYLLESGNIYIGSYNIAQIGNESLRRMIGSVPQEIELFAGSIVENIALGDFEPDMKKIVELSELLGIREFIEKLPAAYMTPIGEHGASLSGGERQRIAIARALYRNPEILIFDEATSSLDSISEKYVKQTLSSLAKEGKTIIIIAHRLSTVKSADSIIVMADGKLMETGTHDELLQLKGVYYNLWNEQYNTI